MLTTFPGEAERIFSGMREASDGTGINVRNWTGDDRMDVCSLKGIPTVLDDIEEAFEPSSRYDLIIIALPAFAHDTYLNLLATHIKSDTSEHRTVLAAAVAQVLSQ